MNHVTTPLALVSGPVSFVTLRFLLGAAEAGFFPGILFYFNYWFPMRHRGRMISPGLPSGRRSPRDVQYHPIRDKKVCLFNKLMRYCIMSPSS